MNKYKNKYRIPSARLMNWNYGDPGLYYFTIVTEDRRHFFGGIENGKMILTGLGKIAWDEWYKTPALRPDMNLALGEFIVMPDHVHGIIMIGDNDFNTGGDRRDAMHRVSTIPTPRATPFDIPHASPQYNPNSVESTPKNKFGPQSKNLASIMRGYKSSVTNYARKNNIEFNWQDRFYDHIIRNHSEYLQKSTYIRNNPKNWGRKRRGM